MSGKPNLAYVVQATDDTLAVKVGYSTNPNGRFNKIRLSVPFPVRLVAILGKGKDTEKEMISLLSAWRMRGEWFEPRPELNDFLAHQKATGNVLTQLVVDEAYCESHIKPVVLKYLDGRQPLLNSMGDMVYRFLRDGLPAVQGRIDELAAATKNAVSGDVLGGWASAPDTEPVPSITLRSTTVIRTAPTQTQERAA